jgi:two-component system, NtrC family, response regulator AtoC
MGKLPVSVLAVDDEETILETLTHALRLQGYCVETAADGLAAIQMLQTFPFDLVLLDIRMPQVDGIDVLRFVKAQNLDAEVIMLTVIQDVNTVVECMKLGAYFYVPKPYVICDLLTLMDRALERRQMRVRGKAYRTELERLAHSSKIISRNESFLRVLELASRAAPADSAVLIQGESGTGKELVADFLHKNSLRIGEPFIAVNCSSIPPTLLESELFGHEKGAFTDATNAKQGLVEIANGGTLFLDEIADTSLEVQPKLLRFLQTGEFRPVGGNKNLKSDVRIISATNTDLRQEAAAKRFREDLLFRINVIILQLPSLRERKDDIPLLAEHFLKVRAGNKEPKRLDEKALEWLMKYDWPGNVRELENVIERATVLSQGSLICVNDLALPLGQRSIVDSSIGTSVGGIRAGSAISLSEMQRAHLEGVLKSVEWNRKLAAKILGISVSTLYAKMRAHSLKELK